MKIKILLVSILSLFCFCFSSIAVNPTMSSMKSGKCFYVSMKYFDIVKKVGAESCICKKDGIDKIPHVLCSQDKSNPKILWIAPVISDLNDKFDPSLLGYKKVKYNKQDAYIAMNHMLPILESDINGSALYGISGMNIKELSEAANIMLSNGNNNRAWTHLCLLKKMAYDRISGKLGAGYLTDYKEVKKTTKKASSIKPYSKKFFDLVDDYDENSEELDGVSFDLEKMEAYIYE